MKKEDILEVVTTARLRHTHAHTGLRMCWQTHKEWHAASRAATAGSALPPSGARSSSPACEIGPNILWMDLMLSSPCVSPALTQSVLCATGSPFPLHPDVGAVCVCVRFKASSRPRQGSSPEAIPRSLG